MPEIPTELHFVCAALPGPGSECVFVELEDQNGKGLGLGEWKDLGDAMATLVIPYPVAELTEKITLLEAAARSAVRDLLHIMWLYPNYRVDGRGPWGGLVDALDELMPGVAARIREGEDVGDILGKDFPKEVPE